jgi:outer membrane immunogenic protein
MRRIALTALLVSTAAIGAQAADLRARAPITRAAPVTSYDWTGWYAGVNVGYGVGRNASSLNGTGAALFRENFNGQPDGVFGGGQIGYNWQFGWWAVGIESDLQGSGMRDTQTCLIGCTLATGRAAIEQKLDWFGTTRGRIGLVDGTVFSYLTAGLAYGGVASTINQTIPGFGSGSFNHSSTRTGWAFGNGVEAAIDPSWTVKVEYLYVDLGKSTDAFTLTGVTETYATKYQSHLFRGGVNYKFGAPSSPLPTKNWAGLYLGGIFGSAIARNPSSLTLAGSAETFNLAPRDFLGGGLLGYNWQFGRWVYGIETDLQGSTQSDKQTCVLACTGGVSAVITQKNGWLGSTRGRVGYAVGDALFYGTAGVAYGDVRTTINENLTGVGGTAGVFTFKNTMTGWTAGGGIESPFNPFGWFGPNWISRSEYRYVDLGNVSNSYTLGAAPHVLTTSVREHMFLGGLTYRLGGL